MARHIIMDRSGHSVLEFDRNKTIEIVEAKRRYVTLVAKGFIPAERRGGGSHYVPVKGERVFNPNAEETVFIPALMGG